MALNSYFDFAENDFRYFKASYAIELCRKEVLELERELKKCEV